ncbi:MAG: bifunctional riboflavin kinase/FAD synthetase [Deltaproteobacteria bacterium]|nr:bifunctional riboflavin kinase/FAD synthetase [Deltaproteobacteria bacterium]
MPRKNIVTLGVFDGIHRGHQHLLQTVINRAKRRGAVPVVYTFNPHPAHILVPKACPPMIMTVRQRLDFLKKLGIKKVVVQKFTRRFARLSPESFFEKILQKKLRASEIVIGYNFTFGYHRRGTAELLEKMGEERGVTVTVAPPFLFGETLVSSTRIREFLRDSKIGEASDLLGHPYALTGTVVRGRGIGGKVLNLHTANLKPENDSILPIGVYATRTTINEKKFDSVTNIGPNPTFGEGPVSLETHLFHFSKNIVGKKIQVEFIKKIREEIRFPNPRELMAQIQKDIQTAKQCLQKNRHGK